MVTASNVAKTMRGSIVKSCSQTTKNKATLPHNNLISAYMVEYWFTVTATIVTIPSTLDDSTKL